MQAVVGGHLIERVFWQLSLHRGVVRVHEIASTRGIGSGRTGAISDEFARRDG